MRKTILQTHILHYFIWYIYIYKSLPWPTTWLPPLQRSPLASSISPSCSTTVWFCWWHQNYPSPNHYFHWCQWQRDCQPTCTSCMSWFSLSLESSVAQVVGLQKSLELIYGHLLSHEQRLENHNSAVDISVSVANYVSKHVHNVCITLYSFYKILLRTYSIRMSCKSDVLQLLIKNWHII
jgi:hypothetical protein